MIRRLVGTVLRGLALAVVLLGIVYARVVLSARAELRAVADVASDDGRIERLGRAARLYAPINPFSDVGFARLAALCEDPAPEHALAACRELRSACLATRGLYTPHAALLARANERIAGLVARLESPAVDPTSNQAAREHWHAARLADDLAPAPGWTLLAFAGFVGWMGSALAFFFLGLDVDQRLRGRAALACGLGIAIGFACFLIGLARA